MISPECFYNTLVENGITFFTGVPDSLLKDFCAYVTDNAGKKNHIINSNEGASVALACGHYLSTGNPALVYMQNSGLGNSINPLLSLADKEVYSIPVLLLIGWRGEPGKKDEPQHKKQGRVMLKMLEAMEIPYEIINGDTVETADVIRRTISVMKEKSFPHAIIISEGTFDEYKLKSDEKSLYSLKREDAVGIILDSLDDKDVVISTTGKASREVYEYRESKGQTHDRDFLTVGSMGHCSQIALGISRNSENRNVYILDGDGALLMQMGSLAITGTEAGINYRHIVINNGAHDSVGGQPTAGYSVDFPSIAKSCGYKTVLSAETESEIINQLPEFKKSPGPSFLEIKVKKGSRSNLGRPATSPSENKINFMKNLI